MHCYLTDIYIRIKRQIQNKRNKKIPHASSQISRKPTIQKDNKLNLAAQSKILDYTLARHAPKEQREALKARSSSEGKILFGAMFLN